jgi:hypothetical protein
MDTAKILKEEVQNPPTIYYIETTDNPIEASFLQRNNKVPRSYTILSYIYLGHFVCLCVCHNCGTLIYSFSFSNQTDQGDGGFGEEGNGEIGKEQIGEGGCEETFLCLSLN